MSAGGAKHGQTVFLVVACAALAVIVVLLARQNARLKRSVREAAAAAQVGAPVTTAGERLEALESFGAAGVAGGGSALLFDDGRRGTVLVVRSAGCGPCEAMTPFVERLAGELSGAGVVVAAVQVDAKKPEDLEALGGGVRCAGVPGIGRTWLGRFRAVPEFVLIDSHGVARAEWSGVLDERQQQAVRDAAMGLSTGGRPAATAPGEPTRPGE